MSAILVLALFSYAAFAGIVVDFNGPPPPAKSLIPQIEEAIAKTQKPVIVNTPPPSAPPELEAEPAAPTVPQVDSELVCKDRQENSALVVIDMQIGFINRRGYETKPGNQQIVENINQEILKAIEKAKAAKIPIIFLQYSTRTGDISRFGKVNEQMRAAVEGYPDVKLFNKTTDGMFDNKNVFKQSLQNYVKEMGIGTFIVTGANGGACVKDTISGTLKNNCNVIAYNKAIADFNFPNFIYPYIGKFDEMKNVECKDCSITEVSSLDALGPFMVTSTKNLQTPLPPSDSSNGLIERKQDPE